MNYNFYKQLIEESSVGYAYHKILFNEDGMPCDYEYIEVNTVFEKFTGLNRSNLVGRKATEILPWIGEGIFDLVKTYCDVTVNGDCKEFEQFYEPLQKWYKVKVYFPEKYYFVTYFNDISKEEREIKEKTTILTSMHDVVYELDNNYIVRNVIISNDSQLFLRNDIGKSIKNLFSEEVTELFIVSLKNSFVSGKKEYVTYKSSLIDDEHWFTAWIKYIEILGEKKYIVAVSDISVQKQLEEEFYNKTDEYEKIFNGTQDSMFLVKVAGDNTFRYIRNNYAHQKSTGITVENIRGKTPQELVGESSGNIIAYNYNRCVQFAAPVTYEETLELPTGKRIWTTSLTPVLKKERVVYIIGSSKDITKSREIEERMKESEEMHRLLITQMQQGLAVHEIILDQEGKAVDYSFIDINESFEQLTGLKRENIIGKTILEVLPETESYWIEKYGHVAMTGEPLRYENYSKELGKYFETVAYSPRTKQFAVIISDITERKKLETDLSTERNLLETTLISVGDGVISTDNNGNIVFINIVAEVLTGWARKEAKGKPIEQVFNIINEYTREKSENIVKKVLDSGKTHELANHTILISKNGVERPIEDSSAPIIDKNGKIAGVVLVFRDFTEKKQKQDEIEFLSYHDQLTGLYNRRFYEEELIRLDAESNRPIALVMADVNGLKLTNDAFGHKAGDILLGKVANILKKECSNNEIVARIGGDEFVILLPRTNDKEAEKIIRRINVAIINERVDNVILSISVGYAVKWNSSDRMNEVFKKAEDDMYRHKLSESSSMRSKTIDLIINSLFEKSNREMLHSKRVSEICENIAAKMHFEKDDINHLRIAGLMHDIGKIGISDNILDKVEELSSAEWDEIKRHSEIGYRILSSSNEFSEIADYVLEHHEKWNGDGYPKGLKGEEISIEARIIAVADAYDAMTSNRTYRIALSEKEAIDEIIKCSGIQFDPMVVKVFIDNKKFINLNLQ